ncbi:CVNH domain-containing protein [Aspergillus varians]
MASQEYYGDTKYSGNNSQSPMPPYSAYPPYNPGTPSPNPNTPPSNNANGYSPQNGHQYPQQGSFGGYGQQQAPPPSYYERPVSQAQSPYTHSSPPPQATYQASQAAYPPYQAAYQSSQAAYPDATPGAEAQDPSSNDRGVLGALAGGAAGAYGGHKVNHGVLGTIGGAITGSLAEDAIKKKTHEKKEKKSNSSKWGPHPNSEKEDAKPAPPAPAYSPATLPGNFSASSVNISLQRNYELVASCYAVSGRSNTSMIPLNNVLTNEFGHFKWKRRGNFGGSARNARLTEGGRVLEAELADGNGGWRRDWVRLDERITNQDGVLVFLD